MDNKGCCIGMASDNKNGKGGKNGKGRECMGVLFKGAFIGGIVMFLYLAASWLVLPWHKATMMSFKNDGAVSSVLSKNAAQSGVYVLPAKPFAFVSVFKTELKDSQGRVTLARQFVLSLFSALLLTCLLKKAVCCGGCPVLFSFKVGLLVAFAHYLPNMIWYHFPLKYSLVGMADDLIAFTLAGAAVGKFALGASLCGAGSCDTKK